MKKTDLVTKIAALLVFLALAGYIGVYLWRSVKDPVITAPAVMTTIRTETVLSGVVVRDETVLEADADFVSLAVANGRRVAKGSPVAQTYDSAEAAERAERIRELELEIRQTESMLSGLVSATELAERETAVRKAAAALAAAVSRHELQETEQQSLNLRSLLLPNATEEATAGDLIVMRSELDRLRSSAESDTEDVPAPAAGIFSTTLDGHEYLRVDDVRNLIPSQLHRMMDETKDAPARAIGKLVGGNRWYFAAEIGEEEYLALRETLKKGASVTVELGRYYGEPLSMRVENVGRSENDASRVLLLSSDRALAETLSMRLVTATLVAESRSGLRIPKQALRTEMTESGEVRSYVFVRTGVKAEKKYVEILFEADSFFLAATGTEAASLREGNEIIVSAKDLYDGKIME